MFVNSKIIKYGALASILCSVVFTTQSLIAQNTTPSPSPTAAASPVASPPAPTLGRKHPQGSDDAFGRHIRAGAQRLDDDKFGSCPFHDSAGSGALLWWTGP
jgi:hypothetical protein